MGQAKRRKAEIDELKNTPRPARMGNIERRALAQQHLMKMLLGNLGSALSPTGRSDSSPPEWQHIPATTPKDN